MGSGGSPGTGGNPSVGGNGGGPVTSGPITFDVVFQGLLDGNSTGWEQSRDVAFDDEGAMYVVGGTSSPDFPVTAGAFDTSYNTGGTQLGSQGATDAFVTKIDANGEIVWSTYLGGPNYDRAYAVEVDANHNVYVAGRAGLGFPTTAGSLQEAFAGDSNPSGSYGSQDGFVTKLSPDGSSIIWSTYFGESGSGFVRDIDIDSANRVHVGASGVSGADMNAKVTAGAAQPNRNGNFDTFYARLSADGSAVEVGSYLGGNDTGSNYSSNPAVRALPDGTAFILTIEPASGAPTTPGAYQPARAGGDDLLLARFSPSGALDFCTYLGGTADEGMDTHSLALDQNGNAVIAALSTSTDYPVTDASTHAAAADVVVSILSADGASLLHSTQFGGDGPDGAEGVAVDASDNVYVTGFTNSTNLAVTPNALSPTHVGALEGLLLVLSPDLSEHRYASYDGIPGQYANRSSMVTPEGQWAVVGAVWNLDPFPATSGQDGNIDGQHGAFFRLLAPQ